MLSPETLKAMNPTPNWQENDSKMWHPPQHIPYFSKLTNLWIESEEPALRKKLRKRAPNSLAKKTEKPYEIVAVNAEIREKPCNMESGKNRKKALVAGMRTLQSNVPKRVPRALSLSKTNALAGPDDAVSPANNVCLASDLVLLAHRHFVHHGRFCRSFAIRFSM